uniref:Uncharacterized protein n=1 Tax=Anguilla anguilla TaxID=7936 RepID=A0A0E9SU96_ANGAN
MQCRGWRATFIAMQTVRPLLALLHNRAKSQGQEHLCFLGP